MKSKTKRGRIIPSTNRKDGYRRAGDADSSGMSRTVAGWCSRHEVLLLFILLFLVYNTVSGVFVISGDAAPASFLPVSILKDHALNFDNYDPSPVSNPNIAYAFPLVNGHYVSLFPIVTPVLITPIYGVSYVLCFVFGISLGFDEFMILAKTSAAVIAALAGVFFYLISKELFSTRTALVSTCIFAFATSTWSVSSQTLWQHGTVELLLVVLIWLIVRNERKEGAITILFLGVVSGLFVFNRPPDSVLLIPVLFYILRYQKERLVPYSAGGMIGGLPFLYYNYSVFGTVFGGYSENLRYFILDPEVVTNYLGLLVAPNVGLFIFCPVLIVSAAGFLALWKIKGSKVNQILLLFGPVIALQILVYSCFGLWYSSAANCFGPRFLTGLIPVLCLYTGFFLTGYVESPRPDLPVLERNTVLAVIGILVIVSIIIQGIGALYYPGYPDKTMNRERAWMWNDSIILGSYSYGSGRIPGIYLYTLPPLPPLIEYDFFPGPSGYSEGPG